VWALDRLSPDLSESEADLRSVPRVGAGITALITEFRETGEIARLRNLRGRLPEETGELGRLPRMTPRRLRWLKAELGVESARSRESRLFERRAMGPDWPTTSNDTSMIFPWW
jgi:DNA polymerase/3'-5' exonuclease PolX